MKIENNKMISLHDLIYNCFNKENNIYIPLIQRNYKWCTKKAGDLVSNLFMSYMDGKSKYTLGMVTLYKENDNTFQLIDGQQRIITLTLILKYLDPKRLYFNFSFERDEGLDESVVTRSWYLRNIIGTSDRDESKMYTDIQRFEENFEAIKCELTKENKIGEALEKYCYTPEHREEFINYILNQTYILIHFSEAEPIEEFLNINKNKTRFGINDHIKANLMIDAHEQAVNYSRQDILYLFKNLSNSLFAQDDIWKLVKQGYDIKEDTEVDGFENRLKVLFSDRYEDEEKSKLGYETILEYKRLQYYNEIINNIYCDLEAGNWNSYNGFNYIHSINGQRFFDLFDIDYKEEILEKSLEQVLLDFITKKSLYAKNCFIQSQMQFGKMEVNELQKLILSGEWKNDQEKWIYPAINEFDEFKKFYKEYINEKYSEQEK
ncbi:DUF262 domain-containing protein [Paenibacillus psychroresistens]|uniref:DUF262 domain-containing protein n=1 Tax=Paenibacillus psychroresistens TaxID=1778678 RepID=A0A6B8RPZ9_9BACL|nr:DUF262 domain-containing protein [Paenibacillus psychroresistens]QGQ97917.1 DUF262 domain-containing protein [Paenibacillus psychroresistens]